MGISTLLNFTNLTDLCAFLVYVYLSLKLIKINRDVVFTSEQFSLSGLFSKVCLMSISAYYIGEKATLKKIAKLRFCEVHNNSKYAE